MPSRVPLNCLARRVHAVRGASRWRRWQESDRCRSNCLSAVGHCSAPAKRFSPAFNAKYPVLSASPGRSRVFVRPNTIDQPHPPHFLVSLGQVLLFKNSFLMLLSSQIKISDYNICHIMLQLLIYTETLSDSHDGAD